ncbi:MAG: ester cyclase [Solirubrobacterales bacterium]|nr:ester cyclase [Solirubrobacterales bacterium]
MSIEESKQLLRRFYEEWFPTGDVEAALPHVDGAFVNHASPPGSPQGHDNLRAIATMLAAAFDEQRYDVHRVLGDDGHVVVHCTWHATHTGEFMGIPATGRRIAVDQAHVFRITNDKIAEHWAVRDDLTMLRQMGIAPG